MSLGGGLGEVQDIVCVVAVCLKKCFLCLEKYAPSASQCGCLGEGRGFRVGF